MTLWHKYDIYSQCEFLKTTVKANWVTTVCSPCSQISTLLFVCWFLTPAARLQVQRQLWLDWLSWHLEEQDQGLRWGPASSLAPWSLEPDSRSQTEPWRWLQGSLWGREEHSDTVDVNLIGKNWNSPFRRSRLATSLAKSKLFKATELYSTMHQKLKVLKMALMRRDVASDISICFIEYFVLKNSSLNNKTCHTNKPQTWRKAPQRRA